MQHLLLLGDSIFDNASYAGSGKDVLAKLQAFLPLSAKATLLARDGAVIEAIIEQIGRLPSDTSLFVISAGGNDALRASGVLLEPASSVAESLGKILGVRDAFAANYRRLLDRASACRLPFAVCTIYDVQLPDPSQRRLANLALGILNDVITREAVSRRVPIIDLRVMLTDHSHFANAIEPSEVGSAAIASAINQLVLGQGGATSVYTGR
ncbi:MAG TPA: SGNH/GDSL hydrolase family protein [Devosia sp.]